MGKQESINICNDLIADMEKSLSRLRSIPQEGWFVGWSHYNLVCAWNGEDVRVTGPAWGTIFATEEEAARRQRLTIRNGKGETAEVIPVVDVLMGTISDTEGCLKKLRERLVELEAEW